MTVQAIDSGIDDLRFRGRNVTADVSGAVTGAPTLKRTISGASTIGLTLSDPSGKLIRKPFLNQTTRCELDGLDFTLGQVKWKDGVVNTRLLDSAVARLMALKGPKKAFRDEMTRAQFIALLFREARVPLVSPEKFITQPVGVREPEAKRRAQSDEDRAPGFGAGARIKVKGVAADSEQIRVAGKIIETGIRLGADFRVLSMGIACATQENNMRFSNPGDAAGPDSRGPFGQRLQYYPRANESVEACAEYFFASDVSQPGGMIGFNARNPDMNFSLAINEVQRSAHPTLYQQWKEEANNTVREYLGGDGTGTSVQVETEQRYPFTVGKDENYWKAATRLAKEVRWRLFISNGIGYYMTDQRLLQSRPRTRIEFDYAGSGALNYSPGVDSVEFEATPGKPVNRMTIVGRAAGWKVPPGAVVVLGPDAGPGEGRWLTSSIETTLTSRNVTVKCVRPGKPLPEPAPKTNTRTVTVEGGAGSSAGAERAVTWAKNQVGVREGSAKWQRWMSEVGGYDPWCSFWVGYLMREVCGLECSGFGHSDYWSSWSGASQVSTSNLKPGDIVGYSGAHVGFYIGGGRCISGNYSSAVTEHGLHDHPSPVSYGARPKYDG